MEDLMDLGLDGDELLNHIEYIFEGTISEKECSDRELL